MLSASPSRSVRVASCLPSLPPRGAERHAPFARGTPRVAGPAAATRHEQERPTLSARALAKMSLDRDFRPGTPWSARLWGERA
eukprot:4382205-Pyramimonas_sp.AAC.1